MLPKFFKQTMRKVSGLFREKRKQVTKSGFSKKKTVDPHSYEEEAQLKVLRESGGQDISAI